MEKYFKNRKRRSDFTLLEMVIVISVLALIMTIATVKMVHSPTSVRISDCVQKLKSMLVTAKMRAAAKNSKIQLLYDEEKRLFRITGEMEQPGAEFDGGKERYLTYKLPEDIKFSIPDEDEEDIEKNDEKQSPMMPDYSLSPKEPENDLGDARVIYSFSAGGEGFGPELKLELSGHKRVIRCSRLTGVVKVVDPEKESDDE